MTTTQRMLLIVAAMLAWFVPDAQARWYDPNTGRWLQRDPLRYVDGMNRYQYVVSNPLRWVDPLGLQAQDGGGEQKCKPIDCTNPAGLNDCEKTYCWLSGSFPALPDGRLDDARNKSGIDALATMFTLAWKESSFNPNAKNPRSTARGLYQILDGTKKDIEDRVWPRFVGGEDGFPPYPPTDPITGKEIDDWRYDPSLATSAAWVYLLDRIASRGGDLEKGIGAYGEGEEYAKKVLEGINALKQLCGAGGKMTNDDLAKCASEKCNEIKRTLDRAVR